MVLLCRNNAMINVHVKTQNRVKHRVWHTDPWPDPTEIVDLVTHDQENWFHLWRVHIDISEYCWYVLSVASFLRFFYIISWYLCFWVYYYASYDTRLRSVSTSNWVRWHHKVKPLAFREARDDGVAVASAVPWANYFHLASNG